MRTKIVSQHTEGLVYNARDCIVQHPLQTGVVHGVQFFDIFQHWHLPQNSFEHKSAQGHVQHVPVVNRFAQQTANKPVHLFVLVHRDMASLVDGKQTTGFRLREETQL